MTAEQTQKVALITGAARRIGAEIAHALHGAGYRVVLHCHRSRADAETLAEQLEALRPDSARVLCADLTVATGLPGWVAEAAGFWGGLDLLVNNAAVFYPTAFDSVTEAQWDDFMGSNLKAPFFLSQAVAGYLRERGGSIVNIVDIYAERPLRGYPAYSIAKAGLAMLTKALAVELAPEVRVNGVSPGAILWPEADGPKPEILARVPLARSGEPSDIAGAVLFLAGGAPYVTGQILAVDGGRSVFI